VYRVEVGGTERETKGEKSSIRPGAPPGPGLCERASPDEEGRGPGDRNTPSETA